MADRTPGAFLERLLARRVRPLALVCALFVIIAVGVMMVNSVREDTALLRERVTDLKIARDTLSRQLKQLKVEVEQVGSEDYIIRKAREQYDMIMPNELIFVVANPAALEDGAEAVQLYVAEAPQ